MPTLLITMQSKVILTIISGSLQGQTFEFEDYSRCIIGRHRDCSIQFADDENNLTISRYHCLLEINPPAIRIRDFGSRNGTYVNGEKIGQRPAGMSPEEGRNMTFQEVDLKEGDEVKIGDAIARVSLEIASAIAQESANIDLSSFSVASGSMETGKMPQVRGYTTLQLLGEGGMGAVYLARCDRTGDLVALKTMLPKIAVNQRAIDLFFREVENTKILNHANVVRLRDYGCSNNTFFFTMDYCDGGSVDSLMQTSGGKLTVDVAIPIVLQVLDGLDYAHDVEVPCVKLADGRIVTGKGLVHRDLKPANIFLCRNGNGFLAKLGDYGLGKAFDLAGLSGFSVTGNSPLGTYVFMPRQQVINFKYSTPDVDVWAVAASLYNMLTGAFPRNFTSKKDPFRVILEEKPVPIRWRDPNIDDRLADLVDLALRDNPETHFKTAAAFKQAIAFCV